LSFPAGAAAGLFLLNPKGVVLGVEQST